MVDYLIVEFNGSSEQNRIIVAVTTSLASEAILMPSTRKIVMKLYSLVERWLSVVLYYVPVICRH